jgi:hypothetical protein
MGTGMGSLLASADVRDRLIEIARRVVGDLRADRKATKQAATALAVLLRGGLEELQRVLQADYDGGGTVEHWHRFRTAFCPRLAEIEAAAPDGGAEVVGFTLGWVRRLGEIDGKRSGSSPRRPARRR